MDDPSAVIPRSELLDLRKHFADEVDKQLGFCFSYLNFYIGLLSALLAATLAGLYANKSQPWSALVLLIGPALIGILAHVGYRTVRVFYRRFLEAWITSLNLEGMLGLKTSPVYEAGVRSPAFASAHGGGFITEFERPVIRSVLNRARIECWSAEKLLDELITVGDTLRYAKLTFWGYAAAGVIVAAAIVSATGYELRN